MTATASFSSQVGRIEPYVSLDEVNSKARVAREVMQRYAEVKGVLSQVGRPDDGTDPTGFYNNELFAPLLPQGLNRLVLPALILVMIAIPTVQTIFKTQAKASTGSLQVEVIGHQWWWEFRYPELGVTTANELYIPAGRTVNFALRTKDVLHSFWTPNLGGKRDLISNKTNYLWYTPLGEPKQLITRGGAGSTAPAGRVTRVPPGQGSARSSSAFSAPE